MSAGSETRSMAGYTAVEVWPCSYIGRCSMPECGERATAMLLYLDDRERLSRQRDACASHLGHLCAGLRTIERGRGQSGHAAEPESHPSAEASSRKISLY